MYTFVIRTQCNQVKYNSNCLGRESDEIIENRFLHHEGIWQPSIFVQTTNTFCGKN